MCAQLPDTPGSHEDAVLRPFRRNNVCPLGVRSVVSGPRFGLEAVDLTESTSECIVPLPSRTSASLSSEEEFMKSEPAERLEPEGLNGVDIPSPCILLRQ